MDSSSTPGRVPSTQPIAVRAKLASSSRCSDDTTGKVLTLEKQGSSSPSERARKSIGSVDPEGGSAMSPPVTVEDGSQRLETRGETLEIIPTDGDADRMQVPPQVSPKASIVHLRKAVLAAVSLTAVEDAAAVASNESVGPPTATANRRLSPFAGIASSSSPPLSSSPSSCPSDHSPSSPCQSLSGNGSETPGVDAAAGVIPSDPAGIPIDASSHADAVRSPTSSEASPSTLKSAGVSSSARTAVDTSPAQTPMLPNRAVETAERDSDSSFSVDDGEVDETSGVPPQKPELQGRLGDGGLAQEKNKNFEAGKVRVDKESCVFTRKVLDIRGIGRFKLAPSNALLQFESTVSQRLLSSSNV